MTGQFAGKTIAITGAAGGIGQLALPLLRRGGRRARPHRPQPGGHRLRRPSCRRRAYAAHAAVADIGDAAAVSRRLRDLRRVHILINNAGISTPPDARGHRSRRLGRATSTPTSTAPTPAPTPCCRRWWRAAPATSSMSARSTAVSALGDPAYSAAKAGHDLADPLAGAGIRPLRHPRQHRAARHHPHPDLGRAQGQGSQRAQDAGALVSARPHRRARGGGAGHRLPRLRCSRAPSPAR